MKKETEKYRFVQAARAIWNDHFAHLTDAPKNSQFFCWLDLHDFDLERISYGLEAAALNPALTDVDAVVRYASAVMNRRRNETQQKLAA
jgi:hypothetical protein